MNVGMFILDSGSSPLLPPSTSADASANVVVVTVLCVVSTVTSLLLFLVNFPSVNFPNFEGIFVSFVSSSPPALRCAHRCVFRLLIWSQSWCLTSTMV